MTAQEAVERLLDGAALVLIEWEDSTQPVAGWAYLSDHMFTTVVKCASVGWLIHDGEDVKTLAPNIGHMNAEESAQASGVIRIPARAITRVARLLMSRTKKPFE